MENEEQFDLDNNEVISSLYVDMQGVRLHPCNHTFKDIAHLNNLKSQN